MRNRGGCRLQLKSWQSYIRLGWLTPAHQLYRVLLILFPSVPLSPSLLSLPPSLPPSLWSNLKLRHSNDPRRFNDEFPEWPHVTRVIVLVRREASQVITVSTPGTADSYYFLREGAREYILCVIHDHIIYNV